MDDNRSQITDEQLAAYLDGNVTADELQLVLGSLADDTHLAEVIEMITEIDAELDDSQGAILPVFALAAANPESMCSFECEKYILEQLGHDVDHWTLLQTAKANNWLRDSGTPLHHVGRLLELRDLHVERRYDASIADMSAAHAANKYVIAILDQHALMHQDAAPQSSTPASSAHHAVLVTDILADEVEYLNPDTMQRTTISTDRFMAAWACSGHYMVCASADTVYNPQPIKVEDIKLDADLEELTEAIAENAHDIWARARMDEGWTYGPVRSDILRQHPDLVPYAQLPESEKQYDRLLAMQTIRLVRRLGFEVVRL